MHVIGITGSYSPSVSLTTVTLNVSIGTANQANVYFTNGSGTYEYAILDIGGFTVVTIYPAINTYIFIRKASQTSMSGSAVTWEVGGNLVGSGSIHIGRVISAGSITC